MGGVPTYLYKYMVRALRATSVRLFSASPSNPKPGSTVSLASALLVDRVPLTMSNRIIPKVSKPREMRERLPKDSLETTESN